MFHTRPDVIFQATILSAKLPVYSLDYFAFFCHFTVECINNYDENFKIYFPTNKFDEFVQHYIEDYDENYFWEELFYRMSERDFIRAYSRNEISKMEMKERFEKEEPFREKWDKEIKENK